MNIDVIFITLWTLCNVAQSIKVERKPFPCPIVREDDGHRPGHLKQLGCQRAPLGPVREYFEPPTPRELYENHVHPYIPAVIRNGLKGSPALGKWSSDEYLTEQYGDQEVLVEKKYEDRKTEPKRMEIGNFLKNYTDNNWYVVSILPNAMRKDIRVPRPLMCSSFRKNLAELNLWIGTRGTRSMLHYDADNIMHCVVSGLKDWILIDRAHKGKMDMVVGREGQGSGFSHLDVDSVDENVNPEVWDVPWQYVTLRGGDCLYLPEKYLHQVRSYDRTVSATFLWYPEGEFSDDDCAGVDYESYLGLNETYVYWTYEKGQETVDMGYMNPEIIKRELLGMYDLLGKKTVDLETFTYLSLLQLGDSALEGYNSVLSFFMSLDKDLDGHINRNDIINSDMEDLKEYCRGIDNPHGPTKTQAPTSDRFNDKTAEFNPRPFMHRHLDSFYAMYFMDFVLRVKGSNDRITFPEFKKAVKVRDGSIMDAFIIFDKNFDGVITRDELNTTRKHYRDFSRMRYTLVGTTISGGGTYESDIESGKMSFLKKLDKIPERYLIDESEGNENDDDDPEDSKVMKEFLTNLRSTASDGNGVSKQIFLKTLKELPLPGDQNHEIEESDYDFIFKLLDNDGDDKLTASDFDVFKTFFDGKEGENELTPSAFFASLNENLERLREVKPIMEEFMVKNYGKNMYANQKQQKTEL